MENTPDILELADRCVMCGLCLPHCPTYRLLRNEADSPRGRIALMQAAARGQLDANTSLDTHLDRCLACRACEQMCPSKVEYGKLIDTTRTSRPHQHPKSLQRLLERVQDLEKLQATATALRGYQRSGLQWLARKSGALKGLNLAEMERLLPTIPDTAPLREHYPATAPERGVVGLFVGCIGSVMEGELHRDTIRLLNTQGFTVHVPKKQGCCGSLHQHSGESATAGRLARVNMAAFSGLGLDAVVSTASGCAAQLFEYASFYGEALPVPVYEVCDFLQQHWDEGRIKLSAAPLHIALHLPCTQRNILRRSQAIEKLLAHLPELKIEPLASNDICCGAAGSYMITQPTIADGVRQAKLDDIGKQSAQLLLSNNLGCALHIANGIKEQGIEVEVMHPISFLAQHIMGTVRSE